MAIEAKKVLLPSDFMACSIWRYDDEDDLFHPVLSGDQLPESERDLSIRAKFKTPAGDALDGYVVGISRVFSIGLFAGDRICLVNKNLPDLSLKQISAFMDGNPQLRAKSAGELFPLQYVSTIGREEFADFSGSFEMLVKG